MKKIFYGLIFTFLFLVSGQYAKADFLELKDNITNNEFVDACFYEEIAGDNREHMHLLVTKSEDKYKFDAQFTSADGELKKTIIVMDGWEDETKCPPYLESILGNLEDRYFILPNFDKKPSSIENIKYRKIFEKVDVDSSKNGHVRCVYHNQYYPMSTQIFDLISNGESVNLYSSGLPFDLYDDISLIKSVNFINEAELAQFSCPDYLQFYLKKQYVTNISYMQFFFENPNYNKDIYAIPLVYNDNNYKNVYSNNDSVNNKKKLVCPSLNNTKLEVMIDKETNKIFYLYDNKILSEDEHTRDLITNMKYSYFHDHETNSFHCPRFNAFRYESSDPFQKKYYDYSFEYVGDLDSDGDGESADEIKEEQKSYTGGKFKDLMGGLKNPLNILSKEVEKYKIKINGEDKYFLELEATDVFCSSVSTNSKYCKENPRIYVEQGVREIRTYCNDIYKKYVKYQNNNSIFKRFEECKGFEHFYGDLVKNNIIDNQADGCDILPKALQAKLQWFLKMIRIAGPILAIALGTVDFVKVVANGDAEKEMKTAGKKFMNRIIAAVLLFVIPFILAFLMDLFLKNKPGYNTDNPFCIEIDWDKE